MATEWLFMYHSHPSIKVQIIIQLHCKHVLPTVRNYVDNIHDTVLNVKNVHFFVLPNLLSLLSIYHLIHGKFWFPSVNSPESDVCQVTGNDNEHRL